MRSLAVGLANLVALVSLAHATEPRENVQPRPLVIELRLEDEAITPITARFVSRAIAMAQEQGAACLVIVLDTPGGLVDSTWQIVKEILRSEVPVVVYVAPSGARAASAGVFITMAAQVAAMAPGTNIGAAHPVELGGLPGSAPPKTEDGKEKDSEKRSTKTPMEEKTVNDTVAWARSLAELRGRNADWAAGAVRESLSVSANAALKEGAIDLLAEDLNELLVKIHGREVKTPRGSSASLIGCTPDVRFRKPESGCSGPPQRLTQRKTATDARSENTTPPRRRPPRLADRRPPTADPQDQPQTASEFACLRTRARVCSF